LFVSGMEQMGFLKVCSPKKQLKSSEDLTIKWNDNGWPYLHDKHLVKPNWAGPYVNGMSKTKGITPPMQPFQTKQASKQASQVQ
jgi:hypothetical protein